MYSIRRLAALKALGRWPAPRPRRLKCECGECRICHHRLDMRRRRASRAALLARYGITADASEQRPRRDGRG